MIVNELFKRYCSLAGAAENAIGTAREADAWTAAEVAYLEYLAAKSQWRIQQCSQLTW